MRIRCSYLPLLALSFAACSYDWDVHKRDGGESAADGEAPTDDASIVDSDASDIEPDAMASEQPTDEGDAGDGAADAGETGDASNLAPNNMCASGLVDVHGDGTLCVDPCDPSPCSAGFSCQRNAASYTCVPACAPNCAPGDGCSLDAHCVSGSTCDSTTGICLLASCAGGSLTYDADVNRLRYCAKIEGSLSIEASASNGITSIELPNLRAITGSLTLRTTVARLRFPVLETLGGDLTAGTLQGPDTFDASKLRTIGGAVTVGLATFSSINLGSLETVTGYFNLTALSYANTINLARLRSVGGALTLSALPLVPWSVLRPLNTLGNTRTISDIGCSICPDNSDNRFMCSNGGSC